MLPIEMGTVQRPLTLSSPQRGEGTQDERAHFTSPRWGEVGRDRKSRPGEGALRDSIKVGKTLGMLWRPVLSVLLLGLLAWQLDWRLVVRQLLDLSPGWLVAGVLVMQLQVLLSAWRWRFTAGRLALFLPLKLAVREYYLALFLNQVLPGGVLGDISRAWRHARGIEQPGSAIRAVVIERASGQLIVLLAAPACLLSLSIMPPLSPSPVMVIAVLALVVVATIALCLRSTIRQRWLRPWWADLRQGLLSPSALPTQLISSALVLLSCVVVFWAAARGIGEEAPLAVLAPLFPLVLLAMLIPLSFAGWGLREGAAGMLWALAGLDPAQGVAAAIAYGLTVLLGSLPGAWVLWSSEKTKRRSSPRENCLQDGRNA